MRAGIAFQIIEDRFAIARRKRRLSGVLDFHFHHQHLRIPHRGGEFVRIVGRVTLAASRDVNLRGWTIRFGQRRRMASGRDTDHADQKGITT